MAALEDLSECACELRFTGVAYGAREVKREEREETK